MNKNVGNIERAIRLGVGVAILGAGYYYHSMWGIIGFIPVLTAFLGWCPLYIPLGINTCKK
jgi:hypothetical protein